MGKYDAFETDTTSTPPGGGGKYAPLASPETFGPPAPERTWWDTAKSAGQTAVDFATAAGNTGTFGLDVRRDALSGWLAGDYPSYSAGVEAEQAKLAKQRARSPYASIAGDVTGAAMLPGMGGTRVAAALGGKLIPRVLAYGGEGAILGGLQGVGQTYSGIPSDYLEHAKSGAMMGGILGGLGGGAFGSRGGMVSSAEIPKAVTTGKATDLAYDALRANAAQYHPPSINPMANQLTTDLQRFGPNAPTSTEAVRQLRTLDNWPTSQAVTPAQLDVIRRQVNTIPFSPTAATDREAARYVRNAIDDYLVNPPAGAVRPGSEPAAAQAGTIAEFARGNFGATKRQATFEGLEEAARRAKNLDPFGASVPNRTAQNINNWYFPANAETLARRQRGLTGEEINALDRVGSPGGWIQAARSVGGALTGGKNPAANVVVPLVAGGIGGGAGYLGDKPGWGTAAGVAFPLLGAGMRGAASRGTAANIRSASDLIHQRNPLYNARAANAPMVTPPRTMTGYGSDAVRNAITLEYLRQKIPSITVTPED